MSIQFPSHAPYALLMNALARVEHAGGQKISQSALGDSVPDLFVKSPAQRQTAPSFVSLMNALEQVENAAPRPINPILSDAVPDLFVKSPVHDRSASSALNGPSRKRKLPARKIVSTPLQGKISKKKSLSRKTIRANELAQEQGFKSYADMWNHQAQQKAVKNRDEA